MHYRILAKIEKAGATSKEKAVTLEDAHFDMQELQWLEYFTGCFRGGLKKMEKRESFRRGVSWYWLGRSISDQEPGRIS